MSGGSFDYLYLASPAELVGKAELLERMRDALAAHPDAARETDAIARALSDFEREMQARVDRISPLWRIVEGEASGDYAWRDVDAAAAEWRKKNPSLPSGSGAADCDLRALVDWATLYASEGYAWPATATAMDLIALARLRRPTQVDAERIKTGEPLRRIAAAPGPGDGT